MTLGAFSVVVGFTLCLGSSPSNAEQFSHWYSYYSGTLLYIAGPKCYPNYTAGDFPEYAKYLKVEGKTNVCKSMVTCLLQNTDDFDKADMQSATIILGLMPTILAYIGPTIGELSLISARRPVLAVFLALGAPAVFATRPFEFNNPRESLREDIGDFVLHRQTPFRAAVITTVQYVLLSMAVSNCLLNSVQLGTSTILSWKCLWPYLQLGWNLMPLITHLCAALSLRCSKTYRRLNPKGSRLEKFSSYLVRWFWNEAQPSANHAKLEFNIGMPDGRRAVCLNWAAVILAYGHWIFGTLVFSSTLFIGTLDAFGVIARYLASALLCRGIILVELAGMRGVEDGKSAILSSVGAAEAD